MTELFGSLSPAPHPDRSQSRLNLMLGLLILSVFGIATVHALLSRRRSSSTEPPTFAAPFVPSFLSGIVAIIRLGADEDGFLSLLRSQHHVVYLPWPLKQYLVLDAEAIQQAYAAPSRVLSFLPIRREMQHTVFDAGSYWKDHKLMDDGFYKTHSRGLQKSQLESSIDRFVAVVEQQIENFANQLDGADNGVKEVNLDEWITSIFFEASLVGLFGPALLDSKGISREDFRAAFDEFDAAFPLLASGLIPRPFIPLALGRGKKAQELLARTLELWIKDGFPGLEKGVIRDMAQVALDNGLGTWEAAKMLVADAWALQANAPYAASQLLLYLLQSPPSCLVGVRHEVDRSIWLASETHSSPRAIEHLSQNFPLVQSCITETLRLGTSVFSIRDVDQPLALSSRVHGQAVVPPNSRIICATRASHLDEAVWGDSVGEWDGRRFFDDDDDDDEESSTQGRSGKGGEETERKSKLSRRVWGFGGGISRCEGNVLATLELKAVISVVLSKLDFEIVGTSSDVSEHYETVKFAGGQDGIRPKRRPGRVGLGVLQFDHDVRVKVRRRMIPDSGSFRE